MTLRRFGNFMVFLVLALGATDASQRSAQAEQVRPVTPIRDEPMHLTLDDRFRQGLDRDTWSVKFDVGSNPRVEAQRYSPEQVVPLAGGGLSLRAVDAPFFDKPFAAGGISSSGGFSQVYGHFEMRAKLPAGDGLWPAFWLLPTDNSWPPEIDVFEYLGRLPDSLFVSHHWKDPRGSHKFQTKEFKSHDLAGKFHVYAIDWLPGLLIWSIDGKEISRSTENVPDKRMYLIANLAVGRGGWVGKVSADTSFPASFDIDYIRVFQFDRIKSDDRPCLEIGNGTLGYRHASGEKQIQINGILKTGEIAEDKGRMQVILTDIDGKEYVKTQNLETKKLARNSNVRFQATFDIPKEQERSAYSFRVNARIGDCAATRSRIDLLQLK